MIIGFKESDRLLYHYTKISTAKDNILPGGSLRIGRFAYTNDPKESKDWHFNLCATKPETLQEYLSDALSINFSRAIKARTKIACFCKDQAGLTGDHTRDFCKRGFGKARMWAQYAENHTGVCLAFNKFRLCAQIKAQLPVNARIYGADVSYVDRYIGASLDEGDYMVNVDQLRTIGFDQQVEMHVRRFGRWLFFEKLRDWRDEDEFRLLVFSNIENDVIISYGDSLEGVFFGDRTTAQDIDVVLKTLPLTTEVMGIHWKNCSPWYDFGNLRYNRDFRKNQGLYAKR